MFDVAEFIEQNQNKLWEDTIYDGYHSIGNRAKGDLGENWVKSYMQELGHEVEDASGSDKGGPYDLVIDGYKTEVKFSLAVADNKKDMIKPDQFTINHVAVTKEWERFIFVGINPDLTERIAWMTKKDFENVLKETKLFSKQQGGKNGTNDDWMCTGKKPVKWIESKYARDISEW